MNKKNENDTTHKSEIKTTTECLRDGCIQSQITVRRYILEKLLIEM